MKVTLKEITEATPTFQQLANKKVDFKTAYRMSKILAQIKTDLRLIENTRTELIKKHNGVLEKNVYKFAEGAEQSFINDFNEFLKTETEVEISLIPIECLERYELSANDILLIEKFIESEKKAEVKDATGKTKDNV